jgi:hypothetical protein
LPGTGFKPQSPWVGRITGVSHWHLAIIFVLKGSSYKYTQGGLHILHIKILRLRK